MPEIHLIEKLGGIKKVTDDPECRSDIWDSHAWDLSDETAYRLLGGRVYFHKTQTGPSFFGGILISWRYAEDNGVVITQRKVLRFIYDASCRNIRTPRAGWSVEMKLVL